MTSIIWHPYFDAAQAPFVMSDGTTCTVIPPATADTDTYPDESSPVKYMHVRTSSGQKEFQFKRSTFSDWTTTADTTDDPNQGYVVRRYCGHDRKLYTDPTVDTYDTTRWDGTYLSWYFHLEPTVVYDNPDTTVGGTKTGAEILAEIESASSGRDYITGAYRPEYQIARITAAKRVGKEIMYRTNSSCPAYGGDCGIYDDRVRFGIARFRDDNGGYVSAAPAAYNTSKATLETAIDNLSAGGWTPLSETLFQLYTYFMVRGTGGSASANRPTGVDGTHLPAYQYRLSDGAYTTSSVAADPVAFNCQKQFIIIITDGAPTQDRFGTYYSVTQGFSNFRSQIGDYAPDLASEDDWDQSAPAWTASTPQKEESDTIWPDNGAGYLDDIALFMQDHDLRGDIVGDQVVDVYTVGFTTTGSANTLLAKTARNGNGEFFKASNGGNLADALATAIQSVIAKSLSFAAATVPASRASDGNNFYVSYFDPSQVNPFWSGHIKLFEFNKLGEIRDAPTAAQLAANQEGDCALDDPAPPRCAAGPLKLDLPGFWDAALKIPSAQESSGRKLKVSRLTSGTPSMVDFTQANIAYTDLGLSATPTISNWNKFGNSVTGITTAEDLADAIVRYARGCAFQSGACVDRGAGRKLFDIFHSNPLVVGSPNAGHPQASYRQFVTNYQHRKHVVYAGSNGGFVHGFNTGEWGTAAVPTDYDRGDGVEEFGFMPYPARQNLKDLPLNAPRTKYYVDAAPSAADVWIDPTRLVDINNSANWNNWHTVLVGGMRQGGNVVYALDVTNPPDWDSSSGEEPTGPAYPSYLWEFPCEGTSTTCVGSGLPGTLKYSDYMGQTWSQPIVTRVKVTVSCDVGDVGCVVEDRWVAIFGGGYDSTGDPNLPHNAVDALTTTTPDYDSSNAATTSRKGRAIFMIDIATGKVLAMKRYDDNSSYGTPEMAYSVAATPAVFDLDSDGRADVVYFGDLGGNLWKWVIHDPVRDPINGSGGDVRQPNWKFLKIFTAQDCDSSSCAPVVASPAPHYRSFFTAPTGALVGSTLWLALGSGERADLAYTSSVPDTHNRFYVMKDPDPMERELTLPATMKESRYTDLGVTPDLVDVTSLDLTGGCARPRTASTSRAATARSS
jgi:type IV pilus assembly protein PilY1